MTNDGKSLESFVANVEEILVPKGFTVTRGAKRFFESGQQEAEFDVIVSGKVGSADITWLIECRDRPSQGAAPGAWIEQLYGRRRIHKFDKVTAVSTTGFAESAIAAANSSDIELRTVSDLDVASMQRWLIMDEFVLFRPHTTPHAIRLRMRPEEPVGTHERVEAWLKDKTTRDAILRSSKTGEYHSVTTAMEAAINDNRLFEQATAAAPKRFKLNLEYPDDDDHYLLDIDDDTFRVAALDLEFTISIETLRIPMASKRDYRNVGAEGAIAQVVSFGPMQFGGSLAHLELHHTEAGTQILLRNMKPSEH
ncbi:MAG: restriction endonuclease [Hyphomonadaceae bacterium]